MSNHLTMMIEFRLVEGKEPEFTISSDIKEEFYSEILECFLQGQIGAGEDKRKAEERDVYHITLRWYPEDDRIESSSDTGNLGLRDGILMYVLSHLPAEPKTETPTVVASSIPERETETGRCLDIGRDGIDI